MYLMLLVAHLISPLRRFIRCLRLSVAICHLAVWSSKILLIFFIFSLHQVYSSDDLVAFKFSKEEVRKGRVLGGLGMGAFH